MRRTHDNLKRLIYVKSLFGAIILGALSALPAIAESAGIRLASIAGEYSADGYCGRMQNMTVHEDRIEFANMLGSWVLPANQWRSCADCLPQYPLAPNELRIAPIIDPSNLDAAPVFRFNANGTVGLMIVEPGGEMTPYPELAEVVEARTLTRCDTSQIAAVASLDATADSRWRNFDSNGRAGATYCPVLDMTAGNRMCFQIGCGYGRPIDWTLDLAEMPAGFAPPATGDIQGEIVIDGNVVGRMTFTRPADDPTGPFHAPFDFESHGVTLVQLRRGQEAELRLSAQGQAAAVLMSLRGSSRALGGIMQMCGERLIAANPLNRPDRFMSTQGESQPEAERLAREALAATLARMNTQDSSHTVDVLEAGLIDLGDGWRFILADVGTSTYHFGIAAYGSYVLAAPPGQTFRLVGPDASAALIWIDTEQRNMGWPRLLFKNVRGVNQPFHAWRWNGHEYIYDREIQP